MIAGIEGTLVQVASDHCLIRVGDITYEVMLPAYCSSSLAGDIGSDISLCTMEYLEGNPAGSSFIPRIIGFLSTSERDFFKKFISVKGIGIKKGLKLLSVPVATIAAAVENADENMLIALPSVGKRMAQLIIAELKGKLQSFAVSADLSQAKAQFKAYQAETLEILIAWGEKRNEAIELIEIAAKKHPNVTTAEELVPLVYKVKQGIEV